MSGYDDMNCRNVDPEMFYPLETDRAGVKKAQAICSGCPALQACLKDVMDAETGSHQYRHGIFAGLTPRQRYNLAVGKTVAEPTLSVEDVKECVTCKATMERGKRARAEFERLRFCSRKCYGQTLVGKPPRRTVAA